ncbi:MAG: hypothetical protein ABFD14_06030 [Anaerolineaceae bacterium]|jgi:hypothetical protein
MMVSTEERLKVLKMVEESKITAEQAVELLLALETQEKPAKKPEDLSGSSRAGGKWLRVKVTDAETGRSRVNIRVPTSLVGAGLKMGMRLSPEIEALDTEQIMHFIESGTIGKIVDVTDEKDNEHIEVYIE